MMPERDDISTMIETETAQAISEAFNKNKSDAKQLLAMFFTVITMVAGIVLWATSSHAQIKDWTSEQDFVTNSQLQEVIKEQYVRQKDFVVLKEKLENLNDKHTDLINTLEKMDAKLDRLESSDKRRMIRSR